jgi:glycosyltransferase involved in cell wall biosynthesis
MAPLAVEINRRGSLAALITAGWPTRMTSALAAPFKRHPGVRRFFDREENIPRKLLHTSNSSEVILQTGNRLRFLSLKHEQTFNLLGHYLYAHQAKRVVRNVEANIYHYRACYGLASVPVAKKRGMIALCDHSIAHPYVGEYLVESAGRFPDQPQRKLEFPLSKLMARDMAQADHILVNSDFVKSTCVFAGLPEERVHVVYLGVDDKFFDTIPAFDAAQVRSRAGNAMLYCGGLQRRKGLQVLAQACMSLTEPWKAIVVGGADHGIEKISPIDDWLADSRVKRVGIAPRGDLPKYMTEAPIFVFPSYCEGSARVIFEAMACGCFIITTPNSGSIVESGRHGLVVPPGDATALAGAISWAIQHPDDVARIGWANALLVKNHFRQSQYGDKVLEVYRRLLA